MQERRRTRWTRTTRRAECRHRIEPATLAIVMLAVVSSSGRAAEHVAEGQPPAAFQPGDISIGEPIALPFAQPTTPPTAGLQPPLPTAPTAAAPGWLGMSVAESTTPGRWSIVDVTPGGPAAAAGILAGDELRGVNGRPLASGDDVSAALTAVTAGKRVAVSIARAERIVDLEILAMPRPPAGPGATAAVEPVTPRATVSQPGAALAAEPPVAGPSGRGWQPSAESAAALAPGPPDGVATVSVLTNPPPAPTTAPSPPTPAPPTLIPAATPATATAPRGRTALGVRTVPIDRDIQARFHLPEAAGAYVIGVVGDLPASKAGIPPGSVIVALADRPVRSPQELTQLVAAGPTDRPLPLRYVLPGGAEQRADVVLQSLERPLEQALIGPPSPQPSATPSLEPGPTARTSRRPDSSSGDEAGELRREVGRLRVLLEAIERRLERIGGR